LPLLTIRETAAYLHVSESWARRHISELPVTRLGRMIRIDPEGLERIIQDGKSLEPETRKNMVPRRWQKGFVRQRGLNWSGIYRVDVQTENGIERKPKEVVLGPISKMTKNAARAALVGLIGGDTTLATAQKKAPVERTFGAVVKTWDAAEGVHLSAPTRDTYLRTLRAWVLPEFESKNIASISRNEIQMFLNSQAEEYSQSSVKAMRVILQIVFTYALNEGWVPTYPCVRLKTPKNTNTKRCVKRMVHSEERVMALVGKLKEPYATLTLLQYRNGLRIEEAVAIKLGDFSRNVLRIQRVIYNGKVYDLKPEEQRMAPITDAALLERLRLLGLGHEWVFRSRSGTPYSLKANGLKRYIHPAAVALGIPLSGWHDLRHSFTTMLRRKGVHPKVIATVLGHTKVHLAMNVYDHCDLNDLEQALAIVPHLMANANNSDFGQ
jgi:integrase